MNFNNDEEALDFFNRLLDRLRQAGYDQHGSHFQLVYVAPGAQHVERQTLPSPETHPSPFPSEARRPVAFPCLGGELRVMKKQRLNPKKIRYGRASHC